MHEKQVFVMLTGVALCHCCKSVSELQYFIYCVLDEEN